MTAKEHFIAHKILAEENPTNYKIVAAWEYMFFTNSTGQKYIPTPEEYEQVKILYAIARKNFIMPKEACIKISEANKGRKFSKETIEKLRQIRLGRKHTAATKEKIRQLKLGTKQTADHKRRVSQRSKNSCWINNGLAEKFILKADLVSYLNQG